MIAIYAHCNNIIGRDNTLPWHVPADLRNFRKLTTGGTVVMGSATYRAIGRPLSNRRNIVLTRTPIEGIECIADPNDAPHGAWVIGGALTLQACWHRVTEAWVTELELDLTPRPEDVLFPLPGGMRLLTERRLHCDRSGVWFTLRRYEVAS